MIARLIVEAAPVAAPDRNGEAPPLSAYVGPDERHIEGFVDEVGTSAISLRAAEADA